MYQVTIKGRDLSELKKAVLDINNELGNGATVVHGMEHDMSCDLPKEIVEDSVVVEEPAAVTQVAGMELDAEGLPWDKRIHSSSKKKIKAGTWTTKRGVDAALIVQVKAELLNTVKLAANPPTIAAPPMLANTPVIEPVVVTQPTQPVVEQPVQPAATLPTPQSLQVTSGHTAETFIQQFALIIGNLISEQKISQEYVNQLKDYFQVTEIWNATDAQKTEMFESFASSGLIQKVG